MLRSNQPVDYKALIDLAGSFMGRLPADPVKKAQADYLFSMWVCKHARHLCCSAEVELQRYVALVSEGNFTLPNVETVVMHLNNFMSDAKSAAVDFVKKVLDSKNKVHFQLDIWGHKKFSFLGILISGCLIQLAFCCFLLHSSTGVWRNPSGFLQYEELLGNLINASGEEHDAEYISKCLKETFDTLGVSASGVGTVTSDGGVMTGE